MKIYPYVSSKDCMLLSLIFRPQIHFDSIFVYNLKTGQLHSFFIWYPVFPVMFVGEKKKKQLFFPHWTTVVAHQLIRDAWVYF